MAFHGKKYRKAVELVDRTRKYSLEEAVSLLERTNTVKFDPTVEIHFNLAIDPKYADQMVRSTLTLPHGTGKAPKIGVFTEQGNEKELDTEDVRSQKLYALAGSFMEPCIVYEEPVKLDRTVLADIR